MAICIVDGLKHIEIEEENSELTIMSLTECHVSVQVLHKRFFVQETSELIVSGSMHCFPTNTILFGDILIVGNIVKWLHIITFGKNNIDGNIMEDKFIVFGFVPDFSRPVTSGLKTQIHVLKE